MNQCSTPRAGNQPGSVGNSSQFAPTYVPNGWQVAPDGLDGLRARCIPDATLGTFGIVAHNGDYVFPCLPRPDAGHVIKHANPNGQKYKVPAGIKLKYYHLPMRDLLTAIEADAGHAWLAGGFVDVWTLHAAGIPAAFSLYGGELAIPPDLASYLLGLGVKVLHYAPDRDKTGIDAARKVSAALDSSGITLRLYQLPGDVGSKYDLNALWVDLQGDGAAFHAALRQAPPLELPEDAPAVLATRDQYPSMPHGLGRVLDDPAYWLDRALTGEFPNRNAAAFWLACQLRDAGHSLSAASQVLERFAAVVTGQGDKPYTAREARDTARSTYRQPARDAVVLTETAPASLTDRATLPTSARDALTGLPGVGRLLDGLYQAGAQPGAILTIQDMANLHPVMGKDAIRRVLKGKTKTKTTAPAKDKDAGLSEPTPNGASQGVNCLAAELFAICEGDSFPSVSSPSQSAINSKRGRKPTYYRLPSPAEVCDLLGVKPQGHDDLPEWALKSNSRYKAARYRAIIQRAPGEHYRSYFGRILNVPSHLTAMWERRYKAELADVVTKLNPRPVEAPDLADLPKGNDHLRKWRAAGKRVLFVRVAGVEGRWIATQWRVGALKEAYGVGDDQLEYFTYGPSSYHVDATKTLPANNATYSPAPVAHCLHCGQAIMPGFEAALECPYCGSVRPPVRQGANDPPDPLVGWAMDELGGQLQGVRHA